MNSKMITCPCGSNKKYVECCGVYINHQASPETPEKLMRSRYTAYTQANIDYISETMKPPVSNKFNPDSAKAWAVSVKWLGLKVINTSVKDTKGFVEFIAQFKEDDKEAHIHEISEFHQLNGKWFYVNGKHLTDK